MLYTPEMDKILVKQTLTMRIHTPLAYKFCAWFHVTQGSQVATTVETQ